MKILKTVMLLGIGVGFYARSATILPALSQPADVQTAAHLLDTLSCSALRWVSSGKWARSALEVPIELNDKAYWFQLDTGSNATMLYGNEAVRQGWATPGADYVRLHSVKLGGAVLQDQELYIYKDHPSGSGTVGLDILLNHYVIIDYPRERFCVANRLSFPADIVQRTKWTPAELSRNKLYIRARIAGEDRDDMFLDTGSSEFPVMVEHSRWIQLTGKSGESDAETKITGSQWGKPKIWLGAQANAPIEVAGTVLSRPVIFYEEDGFFQKGFGAAGLFGNAAFWDSILVLDLGPSMRIGTLP